MNNKPIRKPKNKNSKKQITNKNKKGNNKKDKHTFQDDLIDLLSSSDQKQLDGELSEIQHQSQKEEIQDNIQTQKNNKLFKINNERFALVVEANKYYQFKVQHEQINKIVLQVYTKNYSMNINGKHCITFTPQQTFVLKTQQNSMQLQANQPSILILSPEEESKQFRQFIKSVNQGSETILVSNKKIHFESCRQPWFKIPHCVNHDSLMIIGSKNTGKSALCEYLLNTKGASVALLDCDIGRNFSMEGCISLSCDNTTKKIWIGQLTPLNNLQTYIRAIKYLFKFYRQQWFTKQLIVNTMGYTTGLGQFLLYQIFQIIKPKSVLVLKSAQTTKLDNLGNIIRNIESGQYVNRLHISKIPKIQQFPTTTTVSCYQNQFAVSKKLVSRYQKMFQCSNQKKVSNITDLLTLINESRIHSPFSNHLNSKQRSEIAIFEQSRHKKQELQGIETVRFRLLSLDEDVNMRLVVLGKMVNQDRNTIDIMQEDNLSGLFQVQSLGFGYDNMIFSAGNIEGLIGIVSQGIDFQKGFYHLNEKQLIDLELRYGRLSYIMVGTQGLGSKGMRNNPSKTQ